MRTYEHETYGLFFPLDQRPTLNKTSYERDMGSLDVMRKSCLRSMKFANESVFERITSSVIKQKDESQKGLFQENKARQIFRKTNIFYALIRTRTCVYQGVRNVHFPENLVCFILLKHPC